MIEEVARVVLPRVPRTMPLRRTVEGHLTKEQRLRPVLEDVLVGAGFTEAYTWSLVARDPDPHAIRLPDPMSGDEAILRTTLLAGLVEAARVNVDAGSSSIRLFEFARVYLPSGEQLPEERWRVAGLTDGGFDARAGGRRGGVRRTPSRPAGGAGARPFLHPGKAARTDAGWLGELHPSLLAGAWGVFELDVATLIGPIPERVLYDDVITFPPLRQDIAVIVAEDVEAAALVDAALEAGAPELREARVFDVYRGDQAGDGRKSVAIHLSLNSPIGRFGRGRSRRAGTRCGLPRRSFRRRASAGDETGSARYHRRKPTPMTVPRCSPASSS